MRRKNAWLTKALPSILAAAMVVGSTPTVALAETGDSAEIGQTALEADLVSGQDVEDKAEDVDTVDSSAGTDEESEDEDASEAEDPSEDEAEEDSDQAAEEEEDDEADTSEAGEEGEDETDTSEAGEEEDEEAPSEEEDEQESPAEDSDEEDQDGEKEPEADAEDADPADPDKESNELPKLPIDQAADTTGNLNLSVAAAPTAAAELALDLDEEEKPEYVLMNIPYDKFYENELNNDRAVDAVSSATKSKTRTGTLVGGSYHEKSDGSEISGIIFPVRLTEDVKLSGFTKITDEDSIDITVTNRGQTTTTTYSGKDALFESESYSYYVLDEVPEYYKEAVVEDGKLEFGAVEGDVTQVEGVSAELLTDSNYGDYQLNLDGFEAGDTVYAVILHTEEHDYGLRHLENIWRKTSLAWCTGFTTSVHSSPTKSFHYKSIMGESIESITYYTSDGIYELLLDEGLYVPKKFSGEVKVRDASIGEGATGVAITGLPDDYDAVYTVENADGDVLEGFDVADGILSYPEDAEKGQYTLTISDESGQYAELKTTFILYTDEKPAAYNEDSSSPALTAADGFSEEDLAEYISSITSVSVNGKSYAATGRGAVVIINEDGTLKTDAEPIAKTGDYEIVVSATGYPDLEFTYSFAIDYVLMNIPYADFYQAEINNDVEVDAVTSATKNKPRTGTLVGGSYHVNSDGSDISGVTFPVKVGEGVDLSGYTRITDASSLDITVSNRGQTTTTTYEGKDALFESASYSYYVLSEEPEYYKEMIVQEDGSISFGEVVGTVETIEGVSAEVTTETSYGDYQLIVDGIQVGDSEQVYGVVLGTEEGTEYGLRHLENIWRGTNLAWSTGFTKETHGCPLSWEHYKEIMGQTIDSITYYTSEGIYEYPLAEGIYVPVKFEGSLTVEDAFVNAGKTTVKINGLPEDYAAEYQVEGLEGAEVAGDVLSWSGAEKGMYTLIVSDASGKYADIQADFILNTDEMPAAYEGGALVAAEGASAEALADYLKSITSVSVNGKSYAASGRGAVVIINEDGTIKKDAEPFAENGDYEITVTATGYVELAFTYSHSAAAEYVLMNIPYADFYQAEISNDVAVDAVTSATMSKPRTGTLVGGSYHVNSDGSDITGVTFPVKVGEGVDLTKFTRITDESSVDITVSNRGQTLTTTYSGKDALFESASYSYYVLSEAPAFYKDVTIDADGSLTFGEIVGDAQVAEGASAQLSTASSYGDYQLTVEGLDIDVNADQVYGVVLGTEEGTEYGLRHLENIWRGTSLAWSTGFTKVTHGSPLSWDHYEEIMGQTINSITYYTSKGIYEIPLTEGIYVPVKFEGGVAVENAFIENGASAVTFEGLPGDFAAEAQVEGLKGAYFDGSQLKWDLDAEKGMYTLVIHDESGRYADLTADFILLTSDMPASYPGSGDKLVMADGFDEAAFADYIKNISSVSVNGKSYAASGRGAVTIIKEDGSIDLSAAPFAEEGPYYIVVSSTGYVDLEFTYVSDGNDVYVLMNIPYADFYQSELEGGNDTAVDAVTSATMNKPRTGSLVGGSYHVNSDGSDITGVIFPVKVGEGVDLTKFTQITDESSVEITVTNRGQTLTTTYSGKEALFESPSYSYYVLSSTPEFYESLTVDADGTLSFDSVNGHRQAAEGASAELLTESNYGDYQLNVSGLELGDASVYGVILETAEGGKYGLRHLENIWRGTNLAWSTGFTKVTHGSPLSWEHYEKIMGQTLSGITYFTSAGIYEIALDEGIYVPVKFENELKVEAAAAAAGQTNITITGLPAEYQPEYTVEGLEGAAVSGNTLTWTGGQKGQYTITVTDQSGVYAPISASFILYTEDQPAVYNENAAAPALVAAEGADAAAFADYIGSITSVSVNGKSYAASGRGAVVLIQEDGTLKTDAEPFAEDGEYEIVVSSTGYLDMTFTYVKGKTTPVDPTPVDPTPVDPTPVDPTPSTPTPGNGGGGSSSGSGRNKVDLTTDAQTGRWVSAVSADGRVTWSYQSGSSRLYAGSWAQIQNPYAAAGQPSMGWFHFAADGTMETGWFTDADGHRYYLNPISDGAQGMMLTGWQFIDGKWYYFQETEGAPYGALLVNGQTPDGYQVGADGSRNPSA